MPGRVPAPYVSAGPRRRSSRADRRRARRQRALAAVCVLLAGSGAVAYAARDHPRAAHDAGAPPAHDFRASSLGRQLPAPARSSYAVPPLLDPHDVYAADRPGRLSSVVRGDPPRVYVPDTLSDTVDVIDQRTMRVIDSFPVGAQPQHVTPSYDLRTLWVDDDKGNSLTPIDPRTGRPGAPVPVADPYNLYFAPDGRHAIVVAEQLQRLDFREPHTMRLTRSVPAHCPGVDHMDFTANGRLALVSCEFSGQMLILDVAAERVVRHIPLPRDHAGASSPMPGMAMPGGMPMPQAVKLSPDGRSFYVADMASDGVWVFDARTFKLRGFVPTGAGAHGLYVSRDSRTLYVTNRGEGSISLLSLRTGRVVGKWRLPGGGSPDMGGISADGRVLWLSGRYNSEVYAISTADGRLLARIPVGAGPHGLAVYPQPGRYSLGHTGVFR